VTYQHKELAAGRWKELPLLERMANIGGEVERALELIDLSLEYFQERSHLKEIARMREALVDYFCGANEFKSTESSWRKYFSHFTYAVRRDS